jgi:hypothetical protein
MDEENVMAQLKMALAAVEVLMNMVETAIDGLDGLEQRINALEGAWLDEPFE